MTLSTTASIMKVIGRGSIQMTIGERIKILREKAGLSQDALASRLSVSRAAVAQWEGNKTRPTMDNVRKLASALDSTSVYLLDGSNPDQEAINSFEQSWTEERKNWEMGVPVDDEFLSEVTNEVDNIYDTLGLTPPNFKTAISLLVYYDAYVSGIDIGQRRSALKAMLRIYRRDPRPLQKLPVAAVSLSMGPESDAVIRIEERARSADGHVSTD